MNKGRPLGACPNCNGWAMRPGGDRKVDFECVREGACSIFAFVGPLTGWHRVEALEHRAAGGWARQCLCRRIPDLPTLRAELRAWGATAPGMPTGSTGGSPPGTPGRRDAFQKSLF